MINLVAGGAGFIGSHLCERLVARGEEVICFDDFSTGSPDNVAHLLRHSTFQLIEGDVTVPWDVHCHRIFNLACPASPVHYQRDPVRTALVNAIGTNNLLAMARGCGARLLLASTSEVYGDPEVHPQPEHYFGNVNTLGPRACYDEGKRFAEALCTSYADQYGVDVRIARIFNTYGPRMAVNDGRVVSEFIVNAVRGNPLVLHGTGEQTRSFCYVDDTVEALIRLMDLDEKPGAPVNVGSEQELTMLDLASEVFTSIGAEGDLVHRERRQDDPIVRRPDVTRARTVLGWEATTPLEDGLATTIEWFMSQLECREANPDGVCTCTEERGHPGDHVGHVGLPPYADSAEVERWPNKG